MQQYGLPGGMLINRHVCGNAIGIGCALIGNGHIEDHVNLGYFAAMGC
jgi:hypothetical protein